MSTIIVLNCSVLSIVRQTRCKTGVSRTISSQAVVVAHLSGLARHHVISTYNLFSGAGERDWIVDFGLRTRILTFN